MTEKESERQIITRPIVQRKFCRFIASPVGSIEFHWFEAEYGQISFPDWRIENMEIWQLIPYTLRDLGRISQEEREKIIFKIRNPS